MPLIAFTSDVPSRSAHHPCTMSRQPQTAGGAEIPRNMSPDEALRLIDTRLGKGDRFADLPLSAKTLRGLADGHFVTMTDIQRQSLPASLAGYDVFGGAKTGSGKTLAFLIPVLERLHREKWTNRQGLAAIILTPTRELAIQIFEVLSKVGKHHAFSAGLAIGGVVRGKELKAEQAKIVNMNIVVATPGRLLQHLGETPGFDSSNLQALVLDETDRVLDMGFRGTVDAILEYLPPERQTLLFSATLSVSVQDVARLSLREGCYRHVSAIIESEQATPANLNQLYFKCELQDKLNYLFAFIRNHLDSKTMVFMSSCKQVRFVFESFRKLQPGIPLMHLYGRMTQKKRNGIFAQFCKSNRAVLFSTDVAARGLDVPAVDWVVQLDAPEDAETYIHRVGRTARNAAKGSSLILLLPSELEFLDRIKQKNIEIRSMYPKHLGTKVDISAQLASVLAERPEVKELAQKSISSYARSVFLQKDKAVFKISELKFDLLAKSYGLTTVPKLNFLKKSNAKNLCHALKDAPSRSAKPDDADASSTDSADRGPFGADDGLSDDDDILTIKPKGADDAMALPAASMPVTLSVRGKRKEKLQYRIKHSKSGQKIIFDDDGNSMEVFAYETADKIDLERIRTEQEMHLARNELEIREADVEDKVAEKQRRKDRKQAKRLKEREREAERIKQRETASAGKRPRLQLE